MKKKFMFKKELALAVLTLVLCGIFSALFLNTDNSLFQAFLVLATAFVEVLLAKGIHGRSSKTIFSEFSFVYVVSFTVLAVVMSTCAVVRGIEDLSAAIPLIIAQTAFIGLTGFMWLKK